MVKIQLISAGLLLGCANAASSIGFDAGSSQHPLQSTFQSTFGASGQGEIDHYEFQWPIKDVAVIGAGVSGLLAYRSLVDRGNFSTIRVFERDSIPGGNWHYTDEVPNSVPVANGTREDWWKGDYTPTQPSSLPHARAIRETKDNKEEIEWLRRDHRSPKPVWESLRANTPAPQQQIPEFGWPPHVPWETHQSSLAKYLRSFASWLGINTNDNSPDVSYNTRVENITKRYVEGRHHGWTIVLRTLVQVKEGEFEESWWSEDFDAVVVASGRFNVPWIPPIEGLAEWQRRFPDRIVHSRQFRRANAYKGQNVVVLGASASATEIVRDINLDANTAYLSIRNDTDERRAARRPFFLSRVPTNTSLIGEIKRFHPISENSPIESGKIELLNGTNITGIDTFIFGTGYRYAFPYLSQYHGAEFVEHGKGEQPIITDGSHVRSLFLDTFYIDQPTIAFQGLNVGIQTFVYGKYTSALIATVWSGHAHLPTQEKQWAYFWTTVKERGGLRKGFQWLNSEHNFHNLRLFVAWLNEAAVRYGGKLIDVPPEVSEEVQLWQKARQVRSEDDIPFDSYSIPGAANAWNEGFIEDSQPNGDYSRAAADNW